MGVSQYLHCLDIDEREGIMRYVVVWELFW